MRIIDYGSTVFKDIKTQPVRSFLTIFAIVISSALFLTLVSLGINTRNAVVDHITGGDTLSLVFVSSSSSAGSSLFSTSVQVAKGQSQKIDDSTVSTIAALPHVTNAIPQAVIWELAQFKVVGTDKPFVANTVATSQNAQNGSQLIAGSWFLRDSQSPEVVIGNSYIRALGITNQQTIIGKDIEFTTTKGYRGIAANIPAWNATESTRKAFNETSTKLTARIVGVTTQSARDNQIYVPFGWARLVESPRIATYKGETSEDMLTKNGYSNILVRTDGREHVASVARAVESLGYGATTYQKQIDQINQLSLVMWFVLGAVATISLISASLGIVNTLLMTLSEQKTTIQIWRACGASRGLIARLYILQAMCIGAIGGGIGAAIGVFISTQLNQQIAHVLATQGLEALYIPPVGGVMVVATIGLATLLAAGAAIYPARKASQLN